MSKQNNQDQDQDQTAEWFRPYQRDAVVLDRIAELLDRQEWDAETIENVAMVVRGTGREVREYEPGGDE